MGGHGHRLHPLQGGDAPVQAAGGGGGGHLWGQHTCPLQGGGDLGHAAVGGQAVGRGGHLVAVCWLGGHGHRLHWVGLVMGGILGGFSCSNFLSQPGSLVGHQWCWLLWLVLLVSILLQISLYFSCLPTSFPLSSLSSPIFLTLPSLPATSSGSLLFLSSLSSISPHSHLCRC